MRRRRLHLKVAVLIGLGMILTYFVAIIVIAVTAPTGH